jgi:glyoxylate/hydroxypyruvate reductase A
MTVMFHSTLDDPAEWVPRLQALLPDEDIRVWPEIGDPASIDVAVVWIPPEDGLVSFTGLCAVQSLGAGINQLGMGAFPPHVRVARLVDSGLTGMMTEYALLAALRYARNFDVHERAQRASTWDYVMPTGVGSFTVGVMGLGVIGAATALRLAANGFPVRGWARSPKSLDGVACFSGEAGLTEFLSETRILINLLPLTPQTEGILNARLFAALPKGAFVVNIGRGAHLVDADLLAALDSGHLAGATLDVFRPEPLPAAHPFWLHPRILMTPHVAGTGDPDSAAQVVAENIRRAKRGETLLNEVDRARGY